MALAVESPTRVSFAKLGEVLPMPHLIEMQLTSFQWFQGEGLPELFAEISPIQDFSGKMELAFGVPPAPEGFPCAEAAPGRSHWRVGARRPIPPP